MRWLLVFLLVFLIFNRAGVWLQKIDLGRLPGDVRFQLFNKATGSGEYDLPQGVNFVNGVLYILGVPVATTTALNTGDYVVGDFTNGTDLLIQESMRLEFFREGGTNVRPTR